MKLAPFLVSATLLIVGTIHLLPLTGALSNERLATLYGFDIANTNLSILMRHRAVLFGLLGLFLVLAAFKPSFQIAAFIAGFASVLSFLWIAISTGGYNVAIRRVVIVDWIALGCLALGALTLFVSRKI